MKTKAQEIKTICNNLVVLYTTGKFEDLLEYQRAIDQGLNVDDRRKVKDLYREQLTRRN